MPRKCFDCGEPLKAPDLLLCASCRGPLTVRKFMRAAKRGELAPSIVLGLALLLALMVAGAFALIWQDRNCVEWQETGRTVCYGGGNGVMAICEPETQCVRWEE